MASPRNDPLGLGAKPKFLRTEAYRVLTARKSTLSTSARRSQFRQRPSRPWLGARPRPNGALCRLGMASALTPYVVNRTPEPAANRFMPTKPTSIRRPSKRYSLVSPIHAGPWIDLGT